jgi:excisionase family DNA binding protein
MSSVVVLKIPQVAEILGCSDRHIYRLIESGALPAVDISPPGSQRSRTRIRFHDLESYIQSSIQKIDTT